jgi:acetylornithine deacetylase/succinyl-diaminopimelate desuccinylase-like protein
MKRTLLTVLVLAAVGAGSTLPALASDPPVPPAPVLTEADVMPHLVALEAIADRSGGNRAHGTPGFAASVQYVKSVLDRAGFRTRVQTFPYKGKTGQNVIADWPGGDESRTVFLGAHLDSVPEGPGINDNGSGSAAVLATAVAVSKAKLRPTEHLRFAFWGAEELGLIGSTAYLKSLPAKERKKIQVYLNFDMTGTRDNEYWFVLDNDNDANRVVKKYFTTRNLPLIDVGMGESDHEPFRKYGVPVSGFSTGIEDCIHQACDRIDRMSPKTEVISANGIVGIVWELAAR